MDCPYCESNLGPNDRIVLRNAHCLYLQNADYQDVLIGSGIIVPRTHRETVFDLTEEEMKATFALLTGAKRHLDERFQPQGYNIGWNVGAVGGQHIFHAHLHVIPRFGDEPLSGKGIRYWLKQPENARQIR